MSRLEENNSEVRVVWNGKLPDQVDVLGTTELIHVAGKEPGGVGDPATGLTLMWMDKLAGGSIDPTRLYVTINESLNPVFIVEADTAIQVRMVRILTEPRAGIV